MLLMGPASAYYYANPQVVNLSNAPAPAGEYISQYNHSFGVYYPAYVGYLYYDCTDVASGSIVSTTYSNAGSAGGYNALGDYWLSYNVPNCSATSKPYYSIVNYSGTPTHFGIALSWRYADTFTAPICSFTASPQSGPAPLLVSFTDTSLNSPSIWNWTIYDNSTHLPVMYSTVQNWQNYLNGADKNFDVKLIAENLFGNCTKFEPNYLNTINGSAIVINLDVKNSLTGALIYDSPVGIQNTTSGVWRNSTSPTGLVYFDSTGPSFEYPLSIGQVVNLAASPAGYVPANVSFAIPYHNYKAYLNLVPTSVINATGTFTLVVTVVNNRNGLPVTGASVTLDTGDMKNSNSAGSATFRNVTAGTRQVSISSPPGQGYISAIQSVNGTAGETKMITVQLVREGEVPVTTPVSPTPTATGNYTTGALNEQGSAGLIEMMGQIIELWPLVFIMGFLYFAKKTMGG